MRPAAALSVLVSACWQPNLAGYDRCTADQDCSANRQCQAGVCSPAGTPNTNDAGASDSGPVDAGLPASGVQLVTGTTFDDGVFEPAFGYANVGDIDGRGEGLVLIFSDQQPAIENVRQNQEIQDGRTLFVLVAQLSDFDGGMRVEPPVAGGYTALVGENQRGAIFSAESRHHDNCHRGSRERLLSGELVIDGIDDDRVWGSMSNIQLGEGDQGRGLSLRFNLPLERRASDPPTACAPVIDGDSCQSIKEAASIPVGGGYYTVQSSNNEPLRVWCNAQGWALAARVTRPNCSLWDAARESVNQSNATADCYGLSLEALDADTSGSSSMFKVLITAGEQTKARIYTGTDYRVWNNSSELAVIDNDGFKRLNTNENNTLAYTTTQHLRRFDAKHAWAISSCSQSQCSNAEGHCAGPSPTLCIAEFPAGLDRDGFVLQKNTDGNAITVSGWGSWDNTPFSTFELWVKPIP